jgi:hypothetical protein
MALLERGFGLGKKKKVLQGFHFFTATISFLLHASRER